MARTASFIAVSALAVLAMSQPRASFGGPLHHAAETGDLAALEALVASGARLEALDEGGNTPLISAALSGQREAVARLLDAGASLEGRNDRGLTALHAVSFAGHAEIVSLLIDRGADVDDQDNKFGITPLHVAAEEGHLAVVELLIARGAEIEPGEINGVTPLTRAGWKENWDVFAALKRAGAACQSRDLVGDWLYERCLAFNE